MHRLYTKQSVETGRKVVKRRFLNLLGFSITRHKRKNLSWCLDMHCPNCLGNKYQGNFQTIISFRLFPPESSSVFFSVSLSNWWFFGSLEHFEETKKDNAFDAAWVQQYSIIYRWHNNKHLLETMTTKKRQNLNAAFFLWRCELWPVLWEHLGFNIYEGHSRNISSGIVRFHSPRFNDASVGNLQGNNGLVNIGNINMELVFLF